MSDRTSSPSAGWIAAAGEHARLTNLADQATQRVPHNDQVAHGQPAPDTFEADHAAVQDDSDRLDELRRIASIRVRLALVGIIAFGIMVIGLAGLISGRG